MALLVSGTAFDVFEVVLRDKPAQLLALSPKGTVPVLRLPDGSVLEQSWDIMRWALAPQDPQGWWSRAHSAENQHVLAVNDGVFKHHLDRYKYPERFADPDRTFHREQALQTLLLPLEARLHLQPYLGGDAPCAIDIAVFPFIRQFAAVEPIWLLRLGLEATHAWLSRWLASPLFDAYMRKTPSQVVTAFPLLNVPPTI